PPPHDSTHRPYTTLFRSWTLGTTVDRTTVEDVRDQWQAMARDIVAAISDFHVRGRIVDRSVELLLDKNVYADLMQRETDAQAKADRKSTRLNSSHVSISY